MAATFYWLPIPSANVTPVGAQLAAAPAKGLYPPNFPAAIATIRDPPNATEFGGIMSQTTRRGKSGAVIAPFAIDTSLCSALIFDSDRPYQIGHQVQIVGNGAWGMSDFNEASFAALMPIAANQVVTLQLMQSQQWLYVAANTGTVNLNIWVTR